MKMKRSINLIKKILIFTFLTLIFILSIINAPIFFASDKLSEIDYSDYMKDSLEFDQKLVEIALLGAHDAFSYDIDINSRVDIKSSESLMQGFVGRLIKGFSVRQSKTQMVGVQELLKSGVRYFDMRVSYNEEEETYYTVHNYFSTPLDLVLSQIKQFLEEHPTEFIIIDLQHAYGVDYQSESSFLTIDSYFDESGVYEYAYPKTEKALDLITYGDLTKESTKAGLIIFSKFKDSNDYFWDYETNIRSSWANEGSFAEVYDFLQSESDYIKNNPESHSQLKIMQAVTTMELSLEGIFNSFKSWSLLNRAESFNNFLIQEENFQDLLDYLPIVMVDYTSEIKFNERIMEIIIDHNQN
jgi:hypothetical protein